MVTIIPEIDDLISDIDKGLISIYLASKNGGYYGYFDFAKRLKRLLKLFKDANGHRRNYILDFYYIFQELYTEDGFNVVSVKEVNERANRITYEVIKHRNGPLMPPTLIEVDISESTRELINAGYYNHAKPNVFPLTKLSILLEDCTIEEPTADIGIQDIFYFNPQFKNDLGLKEQPGFKKDFVAAGFSEWDELSKKPYLFSSHVEGLLVNAKKGITTDSSSDKKFNKIESVRPLKMNQVALLCYYRGLHVDKEKAIEILEPYKEHGLNSSDALVDRYNKFLVKSNRVGEGSSNDLKLSTRAKYIESVIKILEEEGDSTDEAKADLLQIKENLRNDIER